MNPAQIRCFLTVAKYLSFSKAAEVLYMSQPVVSRNIAAYEQEIGITLFIRSRNAVSLTKTGEYLYETLSGIMNDYQKAIQNALKIDQGSYGTLVIGAAEGQTLYNYYDRVFSYFWKDRKNVKLEISYYPHSLLRTAVNNGEVDLAITAYEDATEAFTDVNVIETRSEPAQLVVPINHPKANMENPTLEDFNDDTFFILDDSQSSVVNDAQKQTCESHGFKNIQVCPNISTISMYLEAGMGVSSYNVWHSLTTSNKVKFLKVDGLSMVHEGIIWKKDNKNPNIPIFLEQIKKIKESR